MSVVVRLQGISKQYHIGAQAKQYNTIRESLVEVFSGPLRRMYKLARGKLASAAELDETIWALSDISFDVQVGEVVGIIGRNGAGKSTLLKIICRITDPTNGRADLYGRVGALLEVGTGFHPELTGRENVYLNGTILGMSHAEIDRKFDEIVAFAEINKFIDTPVKHYSSGMGLRLGFAVAAHLDPEILVIDEVLAVGDASFQQKCLGKMNEAAQSGRTVLFVSHNLGAVRSLCTRGIWIDKGKIGADGDTESVIDTYLRNTVANTQRGAVSLDERTDRSGSGEVRLTKFLVRQAGTEDEAPATGDDVDIVLGYKAANGKPVRDLIIGVNIMNSHGQPLFYLGNQQQGTSLINLVPEGEVICHIPHFPLQPGTYYASLACNANGINADKIRDAVMFEIAEGNYFETSFLPSKKHGDVMVAHEWQVPQPQPA